ncbi:MAG: molecular chaperone DnaJ [Porticoccaceae bacterium]
MSKLLLILAGLGLWYTWRHRNRFRALSPQQRRNLLWRSFFIGFFALTLVLALSGRVHWLGAAIAALPLVARTLITTATRAWPLLRLWSRAGGPRVAPRFRTPMLEVRIDLATGAIDGTVIAGRFSGQALSALTRQQLEQLRAELDPADRKSLLLLNAYIARRFGGAGTGAPPPTAERADTDEAWRILGLAPGASREDIIQAHKRLMQKLHPDRGGNDYLAAKVNAARDELLGPN